MIDILDRIDAAIAPVCGWCSESLCDDRKSDDFCSEWHQSLWSRRHAGLPGMPYLEIHWDAHREHVAALETFFAELNRIVATDYAALMRVAAVGMLGKRPPMVVPDETHPASPADAKVRALELVRTRNTGPAQRQRAPRRIDPRRVRR